MADSAHRQIGKEIMNIFLENSRTVKSNRTPSSNSKQSILVVDDSIDTLALQRIVLELEGYEVFTAESGTEAFEILSGMVGPNLILLDMQMGDMNGIEFITMLEEKRPEIINNVPIVFLTGMDVVPKSNAVGFIRKPADKDKFLREVHRYIEMGYHEPYKH